jgi:hypothetical protein
MSTDHESTDDNRPDLLQVAPPAAAGDDLMTSWLRTTVPALWGATVTATLAAIGPHLPAWAAVPLGAALGDESTTLLVTVAAVAAWHGAWRRVEGHVPRWVARAALGSSRRPRYDARDRKTAQRG